MDKSPLEVGDIVKCISLGDSKRLKLQNTYTIKSCIKVKEKWYVTVKELEEQPYHNYSLDRFEKLVDMKNQNEYMMVLRENKRLLEI